MKSRLNTTELYEIFSVAILAQMHTELTAAIRVANNKDVPRISNEIFIIEKAMRLKQAQITLIGNL